MRRYIITGTIVLSISIACVEKNKARHHPMPAPRDDVVNTSPVEISLPAVVNEAVEAERTTEAEKEPETLKGETPVVEAAPQAAAHSQMAAKILPAPSPVQYEDVTGRLLAEGSRDEAKNISLEKIREKALLRLKEMQAEEENAAAQKVGAKVAMMEPAVENESAPEDGLKPEATEATEAPLIKSRRTDAKATKTLQNQFKKARALGKAGNIEAAKNLYLRACQSGFAQACHKFAWYEEQAGNLANAARFYRAACDNGLGKSCNNLAFQFERQKIYDKALDLYSRGCSEKHEASCASLKRIREELLQNDLKAR